MSARDVDLAAVRERFPRLDPAALLAEDRPPRQWVVRGLVPAGASVALVSPAGVGKSLLGVALGLDVARGRPTFAGLRIPRRRRVLLVDMENTTDDLAERLTALGITPDDVADLADLVLIHLPPLAPLDTATGAGELAAILDAYAVTAADVVILDSLQRVVSGPENDSDTLRAYYRHTGIMLKRRGVTVIRTDNTGKDTDRGARGSSGKRDDVDVELILTPDAGDPATLHLRPGKVRLPGIATLRIVRTVDDDGRLSFAAAGDPYRAKVDAAREALYRLDVPLTAGDRTAAATLAAAGVSTTRAALRQALRERREDAASAPQGAPTPDGAPTAATAQHERAEHPRRTDGAPDDDDDKTASSRGKDRAAAERRTPGVPAPGAPADGAPPLALSIESGAPARTSTERPPEPHPCPSCGTPTRAARCVDCAMARRRLVVAGADDHMALAARLDGGTS